MFKIMKNTLCRLKAERSEWLFVQYCLYEIKLYDFTIVTLTNKL